MDFSQIALLFVAASIFAIFARLLRQPLIVGYLFAGLFLSFTGLIKNSHDLEGLSQIGVAMLLFLLGIEVKLSEFSAIGKHALYVGIGQIVLTSLLGTFFCLILGFSLTSSVLMAFALTFSSTIILVKLLSEKKELGSLYGRMAIGIMLIQDFFAIAALIFLTTKSGNFSTITFLLLPVKIVALILLVVFLSHKIIPLIFGKLANLSGEMMFVLSIAWALGFATLIAHPFGLSIEIGGYLAGIALSNLPEGLQIVSRTRPIKDFFLTIFFLNLGLIFALDNSIVLPVIAPAILLSVFILIGSPIIVMSMMGVLGYKKRTSFLTGVSIAQISEFSLILVTVAHSMGKIDQSVVALMVLVGIFTMTGSTYLIIHGETIYKKLEKYLGLFERSNVRERRLLKKTSLTNHVVLIGCHRTGSRLVNYLASKKINFLIVDFDPNVYKKMSMKGIHVVLGDISEPEIIEAANLTRAKIIISTISKLEDDLFVLDQIRRVQNPPVTIFTASQKSDARELYVNNATYVLLPEVLTGEYIRNLIRVNGFTKDKFRKLGKYYYERIIANEATF